MNTSLLIIALVFGLIILGLGFVRRHSRHSKRSAPMVNGFGLLLLAGACVVTQGADLLLGKPSTLLDLIAVYKFGITHGGVSGFAGGVFVIVAAGFVVIAIYDLSNDVMNFIEDFGYNAFRKRQESRVWRLGREMMH